MVSTSDLALSVLLPFVVAFVVAVAMTRTGVMRCATGVFAVGLAASAGFAAALGAPSMATLDSRLVILAPLALVLGAAEYLTDRPLVWWALRALTAGAVGLAMLWSKIGDWEAGALIAALHVVGGGVLAGGVLLDGAVERRPAWALADLVAYACLVSATIAAAGTVRLALVVASVAAPLGALLALRIIDRSDRTEGLARAAPPVLAALLGALVVRLRVFNVDPPMPVASVVLLLLAPGAPRLVDLARARLGRATDPLGLVGVILLAGAAAAVAAPLPDPGAPLDPY
jgi:hypothetical protein